MGTGLNLPHYSSDVRLTAIDLSPEMLAIAAARAAATGVDVDLQEADAQNLAFGDSSFDTVVATYSMCNIPDPVQAISEMNRVLRPGGRLILVDHIESALRPLLWLQHAVEFFTARIEGEHFTRRPLDHVIAQGFEIHERDRSRAGAIERLVALKASF